MTTTNTTATDALRFEVLAEGKSKIYVRYAYLALGDCYFLAAHAERERAGVSEPLSVPGRGADASFDHSAWRGFIGRAT